jgi:hypothetical protein
VALVWPPLRLAEGATPLAYVWVAARSTIKILSASSVGSHHDSLCGWATAVTCLPASLLRYLVLRVELLSADSSSLPLPKSVSSLEGEIYVRPRCYHLLWNHCHGLSGRSVFQPYSGCDGSRRSPVTCLLGEGRLEPPSPLEAI